MEIKDLLSGLLSKTLNVDESGVAALFNADGTVKDDALNTLLNKDAERVKSMKPDTTKIADDQYKKGVRETMEKFESNFKDKTGFDSELKGVDLVLAYADSKTKSTAEITDDAVKKHSTYISAMDKLKKESKELLDAKEKELVDFKTAISKKETFSKVSTKALELFNSLKPIVSKDPIKAKNQMEDFIDKLKGFEYDIQGERIVILKDGKALEDEHGHAINFDSIVKSTADKYFDFQVTDDRSSTGNGKDKDGKVIPKKIEVKVPQNEKEYTDALMDKTKTVEEKTAIQEAYKKLKEPVTT